MYPNDSPPTSFRRLDLAGKHFQVSGAANSMMRRWESVFREYPDILSDAENRASVERTIQKLRDYLKNLEDKMEELL